MNVQQILPLEEIEEVSDISAKDQFPENIYKQNPWPVDRTEGTRVLVDAAVALDEDSTKYPACHETYFCKRINLTHPKNKKKIAVPCC